MVPVRLGCRKMEDNNNVNAAILERLERIVESLQDNSVKMGQLLAVHDEKLDKQDRIDAVLFEKIEQVDKNFDIAFLLHPISFLLKVPEVESLVVEIFQP